MSQGSPDPRLFFLESPYQSDKRTEGCGRVSSVCARLLLPPEMQPEDQSPKDSCFKSASRVHALISKPAPRGPPIPFCSHPIDIMH